MEFWRWVVFEQNVYLERVYIESSAAVIDAASTFPKPVEQIQSRYCKVCVAITELRPDADAKPHQLSIEEFQKSWLFKCHRCGRSLAYICFGPPALNEIRITPMPITNRFAVDFVFSKDVVVSDVARIEIVNGIIKNVAPKSAALDAVKDVITYSASNFLKAEAKRNLFMKTCASKKEKTLIQKEGN